MIVKTGANYQEEGGYIEASKKGGTYTLTVNDKSIAAGGSETTGLFFVHVKIINETERTIQPTSLFTLVSLTNVLGMQATPIAAGATATITMLGIIGLRQRLSYSGSAFDLKCDSDYITLENVGPSSAITLIGIPENGGEITMRLYA